MRRKRKKEQFEPALKLTEVQKRWLEHYLEAKRDFQSERMYELTPRTVKTRGGVWRQIWL
jgi:hypothetical protein